MVKTARFLKLNVQTCKGSDSDSPSHLALLHVQMFTSGMHWWLSPIKCMLMANTKYLLFSPGRYAYSTNVYCRIMKLKPFQSCLEHRNEQELAFRDEMLYYLSHKPV